MLFLSNSSLSYMFFEYIVQVIVLTCNIIGLLGKSNYSLKNLRYWNISFPHLLKEYLENKFLFFIFLSIKEAHIAHKRLAH